MRNVDWEVFNWTIKVFGVSRVHDLLILSIRLCHCISTLLCWIYWFRLIVELLQFGSCLHRWVENLAGVGLETSCLRGQEVGSLLVESEKVLIILVAWGAPWSSVYVAVMLGLLLFQLCFFLLVGGQDVGAEVLIEPIFAASQGGWCTDLVELNQCCRTIVEIVTRLGKRVFETTVWLLEALL